MPDSLSLPADALIAGYDFSTGGVKVRAFDIAGNTVAGVRLPTDLWTEGGVSELNLMQLGGSGPRRDPGSRAGAGIECKASRRDRHLRDAPHGRPDRREPQPGPPGDLLERSDAGEPTTPRDSHASAGRTACRSLVGGPWAVRYSLSHLVKDAHRHAGTSESLLPRADWERTAMILPHGPARGRVPHRPVRLHERLLRGIDRHHEPRLRRPGAEKMLDVHRPVRTTANWRGSACRRSFAMNDPIGPIAEHVALDAGLPAGVRPLVYPTLDDQAAGLIGGGAVEAGQVAIILGNSAVVNSSSDRLAAGDLDVMKLNWGPYLWMRCYTNGAQFLDGVVGTNRTAAEWSSFTAAAKDKPPLCNGVGSVAVRVLGTVNRRDPAAGRVVFDPGRPHDRRPARRRNTSSRGVRGHRLPDRARRPRPRTGGADESNRSRFPAESPETS